MPNERHQAPHYWNSFKGIKGQYMNNRYDLSYNNNSIKQQKKLKSMPDIKRTVDRIIEKIELDPYYNGNNIERLKTNTFEVFSRRLNKKDRLVYIVDKASKSILVISILGHYNH